MQPRPLVAIRGHLPLAQSRQPAWTDHAAAGLLRRAAADLPRLGHRPHLRPPQHALRPPAHRRDGIPVVQQARVGHVLARAGRREGGVHRAARHGHAAARASRPGGAGRPPRRRRLRRVQLPRRHQGPFRAALPRGRGGAARRDVRRLPHLPPRRPPRHRAAVGGVHQACARLRQGGHGDVRRC